MRYIILCILLALFTLQAQANEKAFADTCMQSANAEVAQLGKAYGEKLEVRDWVSTAGSKLRASFLKLEGTKVVLKSVSGEVQLSISQLSPPDQDFIVGAIAMRITLSSMMAADAKAEQQQLGEQLEVERMTARGLINERDKVAGELEAAMKKLAVLGGGSLPDDDGIPIVFANQIEITGKKFVGKTVRMRGATVFSASASNGGHDPSEDSEKWVNLSLRDTRGEVLRVFGDKVAFGEIFAELPRNSKVDIEGKVIAYTDYKVERYFLIISKVVKVK